MNEFHFYRTRIAPTPSGYLHIGNAASFLLTAALAKQAGAKLLLRIDDMDKERLRREYVEDIFETLSFLGIEWDEGGKDYDEYDQQYSQRHRLHLYQTALQQLREEEKVFACVCSRKAMTSSQCHCFEKKLSPDRQDASWRLITDNRIITIRTMHGEVMNDVLPPSMQSFIVRKKDGLPAYQLTSLIDDEYYGVDAIVRGEDLWSSTLAQQCLAVVLRKSFFKDVLFYHHPLIRDSNGKLSKSAGSLSVKRLRSEGNSRQEVIEIINGWMSAIGSDKLKNLLYANKNSVSQISGRQ